MDSSRRLIEERWSEVDRLFDEALGLAPEERQAYVAEACGGDVALEETVSRLVASAAEVGSVVTGPGTELLRAAFKAEAGQPTELPEGTRIGPYRVLGQLGRGGMATVYEAERADGEFDQRVAIKVLRGIDSRDVERRFLAERQIMSSLAHPNIARLLDGGTTETGLPYLVMELVEGEPITRWADRQRLDIGGRLDLFIQATEAVQYAHTRLIVHRDLKPSNVLVDADGRVRLLDFGIAKLIAEHGEAAGAPHTRPATRWMTPEYAAPEQILGQPITTATDVHGMGVLLYELLTGRRPFGNGGGFEVERAICEQTPTLPSVAVASSAAGEPAPDALRRRLTGDLDAIVAKALRKEPDDRYGSVQDMRADLVRHRTGFPVSARAGFRSYRARKFLRRHRVGVAAAAAMLVVVATAGATLVRENAETERQRARAETEAENAGLVVDFLADVFRGRNPEQAPSDTITARELLAWGTERVDAEFGDRPAVQAELLLVLGGAHYNLGLFEEGTALLERAVDIRRGEFGEASAGVADALLRVGGSYRNRRDFEAAVSPLQEALSIYRTLRETDDRSVANALESLGQALRDAESIDSAEVVMREAVAIRRLYPEEDLELANSLLSLAYVLRRAGRLDEAEALYEEGIPRMRDHPDRASADLAIHLNNLGYLRRVREDFPAAALAYREALEIRARLIGRGHPGSLLIANNLASALHEAGRREETVEVLGENVTAAREQWPEGHWRVGSALGGLGNALLRYGDITGAEPVLRAAVDEYTRQLGAEHEWTQWASGRIAVIQILNGDEAAGRAYLDRMHAWAVVSRKENGGELDPNTVGQLQPFLTTLDAVGLEEEHRRFSALLPDSASAPAGG